MLPAASFSSSSYCVSTPLDTAARLEGALPGADTATLALLVVGAANSALLGADGAETLSSVRLGTCSTGRHRHSAKPTAVEESSANASASAGANIATTAAPRFSASRTHSSFLTVPIVRRRLSVVKPKGSIYRKNAVFVATHRAPVG